MNKTFLLSSIGGMLAQNVSMCIKSEFPNAHILGTDIHDYHAGTLFVDKFYLIQRVNSPEFISSLTALIKKVRPDYYFPLNEIELKYLSSLNDDCLLKIFQDCKIIWIDKSILKVFLNKKSTMKFLESIGVQTPTVYDLADLSDSKYPLIVKPAEGSGSKGVYKCENRSELDAAITLTKNPLIQEYIQGQHSEYTSGLYAFNGNLIGNITFRRILSSGGGTAWCETINDNEISEICRKVANETKLTGSINIQLRKNEGGYYVFEINPRFSSTVYIRHLLGFKDVIWSILGKNSLPVFNTSISDVKRFVISHKVNQIT